MKNKRNFALPLIFIILWGTFPLRVLSQSPLQNRARGYCDKNNLKLAVENFGRFAGTTPPRGLWKDFQYISNLSFMLGIPGKDKQGHLYPWAVGAKKVFDVHEGVFYTVGNDSTYWGPTVSESWSDHSPQLKYTDWEAVANLNNPQCTAGAYYGTKGLFTTAEDSTPLIATSTIVQSWPVSGSVRFWPGHWAVDFNDPFGQEELRNTFVSDEDLYFAFDDRYATRDSDPHQGYPTGVRVDVSCHVFADSSVRDVIFFDLEMHNLSPYDYQEVYAGLYLDADIYNTLADGRYWGRTNDDDAPNFYPDLNLACIYDPDGDSLNPYVAGKKLAWVGVQLLKAPPSSENLDVNGDGTTDIPLGTTLKATGFHWFDWHFRPGVRYVEYPQQDARLLDAPNKEEIQYKILAGDTTQLTAYDSLHFFHPDVVNGRVTRNPHFDSVDAFFRAYPDGADCVLILSTGPFDLPAGARAPLSFCLIMGENETDLLRKARHAQEAASSGYATLPTVRERVATALLHYRLEQNYPNPFNTETRIVFSLPQEETATLEIFDIRGRKVRTYFNGPIRKGQHTVIVDARNLASGLYFYRLIAGQKIIATKKMLLVR